MLTLPDSEHQSRFRAEAVAAAHVSHPHVIQVFTSGEYQGRPFFVMEFVENGSLAECLRSQPQRPADAARLLLLVTRAVHAAHQAGIVHRDLKPSNVLLAPPAAEPALNTAYGFPKVADFGIAKDLDDQRNLTVTGLPLGTPSYIAPEQASGQTRQVGPATDVYGLGAVLYEMLTGRPPFQGENPLDTLERVKHDEVCPPRTLPQCSEVPEDLEEICLGCLAKVPAKRYQTAQELADDLEGFLKGRPVVLAPGRREGREPSGEPAGTAGTWPAVPSQPGGLADGEASKREDLPRNGLANGREARSRARTPWWLVGGAVAFLLAAMAYYSFHRPSGVGEVPPPSAGLVVPADKPAPRVTVHSLEVEGFRSPEWERLGKVGSECFATRFKDKVEVTARLSGDAFSYLLTFDPEGKGARLLYKKEVDNPPILSNEATVEWLLDDGVGMQVIAVVVSRDPLPSYTDWKARAGELGWCRTTAKEVWSYNDGQFKRLDRMRGPVDDPEPPGPFARLCRRLQKCEGIVSVRAVAFPVL
jgi:serine/threonine protein kinase